MILKLGMEHYELKLYTVYINDDFELTLAYFTTMSNLAKLVFVLMLGTDIRWAFTGPLFLWLKYGRQTEGKDESVTTFLFMLTS